MRTTRILAIAATAVALTACAGTVDGTTSDPAAADDQQAEAPEDDTTDDAVDETTDDDATGDDATDDQPADDQPADDEAADDGTSTDDVAADCSAAGTTGTVADAGLPTETAATASFLLDAAVRCDEQLLTTAATESGTSFLFGSATVGDVFALPEDGTTTPSGWTALATLLSGTTPTLAGDGEIWTWPAAAGVDADDAAWQELVDSGLYTAAQVEELREAPDGYLGWRVGIDADGTWVFMTAGD